jgi:hypothetical protein
MASKSKKKGKKKTENVDIGIFGWPSAALSWIAKQRGSRPRFIAMKSIQGIIGLIIAMSIGALFSIPSNPAYIVMVLGFVLGSIIGSPISFLLWSIFLLLISGFFAGIIADAWLYSPTYWRNLSSDFENGGSLPGWFLFVGPLWLVIWVLGSRGVAKGFEMVLNFLANKLKRNRNDHLAEIEKEQYEQFYKNTDVSLSESRALLGDQGDGTMAVMTAAPSKVGPSEKSDFIDLDQNDGSTIDLGKSSDNDKMDYDSLLSGVGVDPEFDPDVMKAAGISASISFDDGENASAKKTDGVVVMETISLPSIPTENAPVIAKSNLAVFNPKKNRPLFRRMETLMMDFEKSLHEDDEAGFISKHMKELIALGEEQLQVLESLENSGPLLAIVANIRKDSANDFLVGKAQSPLPEGIGSLDYSQDPSDEMTEEEEIIPDDVRERNLDEAMRIAIADEAKSLESDLSKALGKRTPFPEMLPSEENSASQSTEVEEIVSPEEISHDNNPSADTQIISSDIMEILSEAEVPETAEVASSQEMPEETESANTLWGFELAVEEKTTPSEEYNEIPSEPDMSTQSDSMTMSLIKNAFDQNDYKTIASDLTYIEATHPGVKIQDVIFSIPFKQSVTDGVFSRINHMWPEVRKFLPGSLIEEYKAELVKIGRLADQMLETPHLIDEMKVSKLDGDFSVLSKKVSSSHPSVPVSLKDNIRDTSESITRIKNYINGRKASAAAASLVSAKASAEASQDDAARRGREKSSGIFHAARETGDMFSKPTKNDDSASSQDPFLLGASPAGVNAAADADDNAVKVSLDEIDFSTFSCPYEIGSKAYERSKEAFIRVQIEEIKFKRELEQIELEEKERKEREALLAEQAASEGGSHDAEHDDESSLEFEPVSLDTPSSSKSIEAARIKILAEMAEELKQRQQVVIDMEKKAAEEKLRKEKAEADQAETQARLLAVEASEKEHNLKSKIEEIAAEKNQVALSLKNIEEEKERVFALKSEVEKQKEDFEKISARSISPVFDEAVFDFAHSLNEKARIPARFQKKKIIASLILTTKVESRPVMTQFSSRNSVSQNGELNIEEIALSPHWQSFYMNKLEVANEYKNVLNSISSILDIPTDSSFEEYQALLEAGEELFFRKVWTEVSQIESTMEILRKVEEFNASAIEGLKSAEIIKAKDQEISSMSEALDGFKEKVEKLEAELAQKKDDVAIEITKDLDETRLELSKALRRIKDLETRSKGLIFEDALQDFLDNRCFFPPEFEHFNIPGIYAFKASNGATHVFLTMKQSDLVSGFDPIDPENFSAIGPDAFADKVNNISLHRKAKVVFTNNLDSYFPLSEKNVRIKREEFNPSNFE